MKLYGLCPRKFKARDKTIVQAWRNLTGLTSIPAGRQYWTLCGPMAAPEGGLQEGCELRHVLDAGLLRTADQFHGVERDAGTHASNQKVTQGLEVQPNLHLGEIHEVLRDAHAAGNFRPAIVNLDTLFMPEKAARLLGEVLYVVNHVPGPVMVVLNTILHGRYLKFTMSDLVKAVERDSFCAHQLSYGWLESEEGFTYMGTGGGRGVKMGTVIYFQPFKEAALAG